MRDGTEVLNCFYKARKISNISIIEFSNPGLLSKLGLIYTDCFFCARRESALRAAGKEGPLKQERAE
jgi:hypothetical protein